MDHFRLGGGGGAGDRLTHSILADVQQGTSSKLCGTVITREKKVSVFFFTKCSVVVWRM